jgi:hypothetical protein
VRRGERGKGEGEAEGYAKDAAGWIREDRVLVSLEGGRTDWRVREGRVSLEGVSDAATMMEVTVTMA